MLVRDLSWLLEVAERGHVTEAAAVIGTTQPTLSRALARLEGELGVPVLLRVPDGVRTTPVGETVLAAARDIVRRHDELRQELAAQLDPHRGLVRLAFVDSIATSVVPRVLRAVHERLPGLQVLLTQEAARDVLDDLEGARVDLAITSMRPEAPHGWHLLQQERLVLVVPPSHRWRHRQLVRPQELDGEEMVTVPTGFGYRALVDTLLQAAGARPRITFESQDLATIEGLVAAGLGVAILPEALAGVSGTVGMRIRAPGARRSIGLAWRLDGPLAPPAAGFLDVVRGMEPDPNG